MVDIGLWDTAGQDDYARLRPISYPGADIFIICFAIDRMDSFSNITSVWIPEAIHYGKDVPRILIGMKHDLRDSEVFGPLCVPIEEVIYIN